ncbi:MAG: 50S ribosomal protein L25 [Endomicrobiaceae bacterium]|nr:50S ribosomal protein L25 [Endomicrobiaceae bacterium]MDD3922693.1 50S ribosomal protein L25 [Endomicrobiaceae bacterium]
MKQVALEAEIREVSQNLNVIRNAGKIPAVFYGKNETPIAVTVDTKKFMTIVGKEGANVIIELKFKDFSKTAIIKELQRHVLTQAPNHVDFQAISLKEKINILVPVHIDGIADGVKNSGGTLEHILREIKVRCLPTDIPSKISVDVSALKIGEALTVSQLPKIDGVEYENDPTNIVVNIIALSVEEEKPVDVTAVPQAPEVIAKGKKEEEGAEGTKK